MQRMLQKSEERKAIEVLFGSAGVYVDPILWEPIGSCKVCQRSIALREHEVYSVTDCRIQGVLTALKGFVIAHGSGRSQSQQVLPTDTGGSHDQRWFMASGDICNAFHCLLRRVWFAISHCQLSVQNRRDLSIVVSRDERLLSLSLTWCHLLPRHCPCMGCSWSIYFCQDAALHKAAKSGMPRCIPVISHRSFAVLQSSDQGENWTHGLIQLCHNF